jgi:hypothetical protein
MKTSWILSLLFCGLLFGALRAEDEVAAQKVPIDQTALIPKASSLCVRLPSLDRIDAIAKRFASVAELAQGPQAKQFIEAGVTNLLIGQMGLDPAGFDRTAPLYLAMHEGSQAPYLILTPAKTNGITGEKDLPTGVKLIVKDGAIHVGTAELLAAERRGTAIKLLKGDFAAKFLVGELVSRHKEEIEKGLVEAKAEMGNVMKQTGLDLPIDADALIAAMKTAIYGIQDVDFAATFDEKYIITEGLVTTKAESALRKMLARAGAPRENNLTDYLPSEAFMMIDTAVTPDWPIIEVTEFLKTAAGEEIAESFAQMVSMSKPMWDSLTGRTGISMTMQGMMGFNMHAIYELKEGTDSSKLFEKFDVEKMNAAMKKMNLPMTYVIEKNIAKHGETPLHKFSMTSEDPDMQMALMMSTYYMAAEGNHMFICMSMNAELEIKDLIDRVRKGAPKKMGAHSKAMDRLGRKRNMGMTINFGALKPVLMMVAMADASGEANMYLNAMPDELLMSTAVSIHDGDIHWRGDLPLKKILKMVDDIKALKGDAEGDAPGGDSEFD